MTRAPRRRITLASYRSITLLVLLALAVIVVSGAAVRLVKKFAHPCNWLPRKLGYGDVEPFTGVTQ